MVFYPGSPQFSPQFFVPIRRNSTMQIGRVVFEEGTQQRRAHGSICRKVQKAICGVQVDKLYKHFAAGQAEDTGTTVKIKLADSGMNCERLGRHIPGFFRDKFEVEVKVDLYERIAAGRRRVAEAAARAAAARTTVPDPGVRAIR